MPHGDLFARGFAVRRRVLGDAHVDGSSGSPRGLEPDFERHITEHCWGAVWADERLGLRERSIATLAATAALGGEHWLSDPHML